MILRLLLWSLADSKTTVGELRRHLRDEAVEEVSRAQGLKLIGKEPEVGEEFDLEASVEGRFTREGLSRLGLAFE